MFVISSNPSSLLTSKPLKIPTSARLLLTLPHTSNIFGTTTTTTTTKRTTWNPRTTIKVSSSPDNQTTISTVATLSVPTGEEDDDGVAVQSASDVVKRFYEGINGHDLESVEELIAENCVYEDLIFPRPFVGRKAILEFFKKFIDSISSDLQFVIDDISSEDSVAIGVTWHLEWKGKSFPFSKGCSFYRLEVVDGNRKITYGRDSVEPAIKPGEAALAAIRGVTWLLQQFPQIANQL